MKELNEERVKLFDKAGMLGLIEGLPGQLQEASAIGANIDFAQKLNKDFDNIVFSGMGGSAIGADIVKSYLSRECRVPIIVNRDYGLPAFVGKKTLLIISSYSGNTEETISAYREGRKSRSVIIAITTGGELKKLAERDGVFCVNIPGGLPPRCALGYSSVLVIALLSKLGIIPDKDKDIKDAAAVLTELRDKALSPALGEEINISKKIAKEICGRYAVIYGASPYTDSIATRWRGQLAENSKTISSVHLFPEMTHNEIVGWAYPKDMMKNFIVIILRDEADHPRVTRRMDISKVLIEKEGVKVVDVASVGKTLLGRLFSLVYIGDFASLYLAVLNGADPTPVDNITYLKEELAKN